MRNNTQKLTTQVFFHLPLRLIFKQIEDCQQFETSGNTMFTQEQTIQAAKIRILAIGCYPVAYCEWVSLQEIDKIYQRFRDLFLGK